MVTHSFCGAYCTERATSYLSGLDDEQYSCLNRYLNSILKITLTQKVARAAAAAKAEDIIESYPKIIANGEKVKEDDEHLESKKRNNAIA